MPSWRGYLLFSGLVTRVCRGAVMALIEIGSGANLVMLVLRVLPLGRVV